MEDIVVPVVAILSGFVLAPLAIGFARVMWKRASEPRPLRQLETDSLHRRLDQLQASVEAMAIEVERISEGQRFVTKIMAERDRDALGSGAPRRGS